MMQERMAVAKYAPIASGFVVPKKRENRSSRGRWKYLEWSLDWKVLNASSGGMRSELRRSEAWAAMGSGERGSLELDDAV